MTGFSCIAFAAYSGFNALATLTTDVEIGNAVADCLNPVLGITTKKPNIGG